MLQSDHGAATENLIAELGRPSGKIFASFSSLMQRGQDEPQQMFSQQVGLFRVEKHYFPLL